jgi:hypothetical protein
MQQTTTTTVPALARPGMRAIMYHRSPDSDGADGDPCVIEAVYPGHCVARGEGNGMLYAQPWEHIQLLDVAPDLGDDDDAPERPKLLLPAGTTATLKCNGHELDLRWQAGRLPAIQIWEGASFDGANVWFNEDADEDSLGYVLKMLIEMRAKA